jgi:hypothetical protein
MNNDSGDGIKLVASRNNERDPVRSAEITLLKGRDPLL